MRGRPFSWAALAVALVASASASPRATSGPSEPASQVESSGRGVVKLSAPDRDALGIQGGSVRRAELRPAVEATGTASFAPQQSASVGAGVPGVVRSVKHVSGDAVTAGEVLAIVESAELGMREGEVDALRARSHAAALAADRAEKLFQGGLSTARAVERTAASSRVLSSELAAAEHRVSVVGRTAEPGVYAIRSPLSGTIVAQHVHVGESVRHDSALFEVADPRYLWVDLAMQERSVRAVHEDDPVEVTPLGGSDRALPGRVQFVASQLNGGTTTVSVRVAIDNRGRSLRAGEAVVARLHPSGQRVSDALVVAKSAVVHVDGSPLVFELLPGGDVRPTAVKLGDESGPDQSILSGISAGATVVTGGAAALRDRLYR